jgi:hypothetical protein
MVTDIHTVPETYTESEYDSFSGHHRTVTRTRMVTRHDTRQKCDYETVQREVTRFVYQFHTGFVPPDLGKVARYQPRLKIEESAPECTLLEPGDGKRVGQRHRIEARVHGCSDFGIPPEVNKPEAEMSKAEHLRHQYRLKALAAKSGPACTDKVIRLEQPEAPPDLTSSTGDGGASVHPCRDSAPPEVKKPEAEMSKAERLRHQYRLKALAEGKKDCEALQRAKAAEPGTSP